MCNGTLITVWEKKIMHKIGLVTVTYINNYGSHLQSFALQEELRILGYVPEIIDIESVRDDVNKKRRLYVLTRVLDFEEMMAYYQILRRRIACLFDKEYRRIRDNRLIQFKKFSNEKYNLAERVDGWGGLAKQCSDNYEAVIVGSDQNWRPANIAGGFYTLEFVPFEINKIAYATSFGIDHVIDKQKRRARYFLDRIDHLSVREMAGKKIIKELIGRDVPVVLDPTLLLSSDQWDEYIPRESIIKGDYILCYFLGANKAPWEFVKRISKLLRIKTVGILYGEMYRKGLQICVDEKPQNIGPFEFVNLIRHANFVCTDSFHGCAFSINYNRNLFAFYKFASNGKMSTNNRVDSLLSLVGLNDRLFRGNEKIDGTILEDMDYSYANECISRERRRSIEYLIKALENDKPTE